MKIVLDIPEEAAGDFLRLAEKSSPDLVLREALVLYLRQHGVLTSASTLKAGEVFARSFVAEAFPTMPNARRVEKVTEVAQNLRMATILACAEVRRA